MRLQPCCAGLLFAWLGVIALAGCNREETESSQTLRPVRYQQVYATGGTRVRNFSGLAQAAVESRLSFRVAGTVDRLYVKVGDVVSAGQPIAELDAKDFELQVQEAEASLEQARAAARRSAADYERVRQLYENRNASRSDLDAARAADESARAQVSASEKRLELARAQLGYTKLVAAIDGAIAEVAVEINENVKAGDKVVVMTSGSRLEVRVAMPGLLIAQVREGDIVNVRFDAVVGRTFPARVSEVGIAAMGAQTTFPVTVLLSTTDPELRPGLSAEVAFTFQSGDSRDCFLVPPVAVREDRSGRHAFVVRRTGPTTGIVERREVVIGALTTDGLEVFQGLNEGDLLVTAGVSRLYDSLAVALPAVEADPS